MSQNDGIKIGNPVSSNICLGHRKGLQNICSVKSLLTAVQTWDMGHLPLA